MKILKLIVVMTWLFLSFVLITTRGVTAGGDKDNGKELFKQNCRVCHEKDSPNGEFTPMSLTQDQWKAFFKNKFEAKHKDVILDREKKKLLEFLTTQQIEAIQKFCVDHAADSEQPQTCSE
ncbi:MAG: cytochrome c [Acidobacteria bacterium]|nr:cytochrome c [Acidobacteriota bacterium]